MGGWPGSPLTFAEKSPGATALIVIPNSTAASPFPRQPQPGGSRRGSGGHQEIDLSRTRIEQLGRASHSRDIDDLEANTDQFRQERRCACREGFRNQTLAEQACERAGADTGRETGRVQDHRKGRSGYCAAGVRMRIRWLCRSAMKRLPAPSTATPEGRSSRAAVAVPPSPLNPYSPVPATVLMTPAESTLRIR